MAFTREKLNAWASGTYQGPVLEKFQKNADVIFEASRAYYEAESRVQRFSGGDAKVEAALKDQSQAASKKLHDVLGGVFEAENYADVIHRGVREYARTAASPSSSPPSQRGGLGR